MEYEDDFEDVASPQAELAAALAPPQLNTAEELDGNMLMVQQPFLTAAEAKPQQQPTRVSSPPDPPPPPPPAATLPPSRQEELQPPPQQEQAEAPVVTAPPAPAEEVERHIPLSETPAHRIFRELYGEEGVQFASDMEERPGVRKTRPAAVVDDKDQRLRKEQEEFRSHVRPPSSWVISLPWFPFCPRRPLPEGIMPHLRIMRELVQAEEYAAGVAKISELLDASVESGFTSSTAIACLAVG